MSPPDSSSASDSLEKALLAGEGAAPLAAWLALLLPLQTQRDLVRTHAVRLKGFRVERAPAAALQAALAKETLESGELRRDLLGRLQALCEPSPAATPPPPPPVVEEISPLLEERDRLAGEVVGLQGQLASLEGRIRTLEERLEVNRRRREEAEAQVERDRHTRHRMESRLRKLKELAPMAKEATRLAGENKALLEENERLRATVAAQVGRSAALEEEVEELAAKAGGKRRTGEAAPLPKAEGQVLVPRFGEAFMQALHVYPGPTVRRILFSVFMACLDPGYTSLHFKKLEGPGDLWSIRSGPSLRIYFRRTERDLDLLHVGDREEQPQALKALRERHG